MTERRPRKKRAESWTNRLNPVEKLIPFYHKYEHSLWRIGIAVCSLCRILIEISLMTTHAQVLVHGEEGTDDGENHTN